MAFGAFPSVTWERTAKDIISHFGVRTLIMVEGHLDQKQEAVFK
jgi:hypothetical protein